MRLSVCAVIVISASAVSALKIRAKLAIRSRELELRSDTAAHLLGKSKYCRYLLVAGSHENATAKR